MSDLDAIRARAAARAKAQNAQPPAAPAGQTIIADYGEKGRVVEVNGKRSFVSPSYSTSDPTRIAQIMEGLDAGRLSKRDYDRETIAAAPAAARAVKMVEGIPFVGSYVDEALGGLLGDDATAGVRALSGAMDRENPGQSLGLNLTGLGLGTVAALGAAPAKILSHTSKLRTIPGMLKGAAVGAGAGAVEGGVYGAGRGTDEQSRAEEAALGAGMGAGAGAAVGVAAPLIGKGVARAYDFLRKTDVDSIAGMFRISKPAAKIIKATFMNGGDVEIARQNLEKAGQHAMLSDAGQAAQALTDFSVQYGGAQGEVVAQQITQRALQNRDSFTKATDAILGSAELGPETALEQIAKRSAPFRESAFKRAFMVAVDPATPKGKAVTDVLQRINPSVLNEAIAEVNEDIIASGSNKPLVNIIRHPETGALDFSQPLSMEHVHEIKVTLQQMAQEAYADFKPTKRSIRYSNLARDLRAAMGGLSEEYNQAMAMGGDKIQQETNLQLGYNLLAKKTHVEDVSRTMGEKPSQTQIAAAKAGLRLQIDEIMGNARALASDPNIEARELKAAFDNMNSSNSRKKMRALLGDKEAEKLFAEIDAAQQTLLVRAATARNSATAPRQALEGEFKAVTAPGAADQLMAGKPQASMQTAIQNLTGTTEEFSQKQQQKIVNDIGNALMRYRGRDAGLAFEALRAYALGQPVKDAQREAMLHALLDIGYAGKIPAFARAGVEVEHASEGR